VDDQPFYTRHVFVCTNQRSADDPRGCCAAGGSERLRDYLKLKAKQAGLPRVRVNNAGCLDRCALGPVMVIYPEGVWYGYKTEADIDEIFASHVVGGHVVERLRLKSSDRRPAKPLSTE
jgi:(2Fe-2S) ferredoxin